MKKATSPPKLLSLFQGERVVLPDQDDKDAALFPEKVNGRYMLYHKVKPDI